MKFQILSHAGLLLESQGVQLICDPWILGSSYWRSWWNYPPVADALIESLKPDYIYLTHIHWDHFHGPSLRKLGKHIPIIIPKAPGLRMRSDLEQMGFKHIIELQHGETLELKNDFNITSYHFSPFLDSCLVIDAEGVTLFNSNDAKIMGAPLKQVLKKHPHIDFVFRSHSSANSRLCYEFIDEPSLVADDRSRYVRDFVDFCAAVNARYAIPFASNHCYLHQDVFHFNQQAVTPFQVQQYAQSCKPIHSDVKIMLSGDSWSSEEGFIVQDNTYFSEKEGHLADYREKKRPILEKFYVQESKADVSLTQMNRYFEPFLASIPAVLRYVFKKYSIVYVLYHDNRQRFFSVNVYGQLVTERDSVDDVTCPIQIHVPFFVMRHCLAARLFSHLPISKRCKYRTDSRYKKIMMFYNFLFNLYEYELIPFKQVFSVRMLQAIRYRWREGLLYGHILVRLFSGKKLSLKDHLPQNDVSIDVIKEQ